MLAWLKRHPVPMEAFFRHSLVLAYAYPSELLSPLLPQGLELDTYEGLGFLAIALVQVEGLRPTGLPALLGRDFFLSGYRVFCRFRRSDGSVLRGLKILRSDSDSRSLTWIGNRLTHYRYSTCKVETRRSEGSLEIQVRTPGGETDLVVRARLDETPAAPPLGSPFPDLATARRFAGPLPYTFDGDGDSLVLVEGVRRHWQPRAVTVEVERCQFLDHPPFDSATPRLANAFLVEEVPYTWKRGVRVPMGLEVLR